MRHKSSRRRLNQKPDHSRLIERNLVTSVLLYESIRTTKKRARVVQPLVERLITTAKQKKPYVAIRAINTVVTDKNASRKLMEVLKERFASRTSGFTRVVPVGARKGDGAELVDLSLIDAQLNRKAQAPVAQEKKEKPAAKKPSSQKTAKSA